MKMVAPLASLLACLILSTLYSITIDYTMNMSLTRLLWLNLYWIEY